MAGMGSMGGWLATKYGILQQQADTAASEAASRGNVQAAEANRIRQTTDPLAMGMRNQASLWAAQAGRTAAETPWVGPQAQSQIALQGAQGRLYGAQATGFENLNQLAPGADALAGQVAGTWGVKPTTQIGQGVRLGGGMPSMAQGGYNPRDPQGLGNDPSLVGDKKPGEDPMAYFLRTNPNMVQASSNSVKPAGYKKGTSRVPGKGDGTKDTVPAKLAPGEAVLNKAAAEHVGRGLIAHLNAAGAEKMGLVAPPQKGKMQNFAAGTEEVRRAGC